MGKIMAVLENDRVAELNWYSDREEETDRLVETNGKPADIGDSYADGKFYRNGEEILSDYELLALRLEDAQDALALLGVTDEPEVTADDNA